MSDSEYLLRVEALSTVHIGPVSFAAAAGECVGISGPSGSGKSLILRALADLDPHGGEVFLDGQAAASLAPSAWRQKVGLLPAEAAWWADRVGAHFAEDAGLTPILGELGFGAEVLDWQVARCSTGERQRLALARLLQQRPQVLLLDEPTAALDHDNTLRVERLIGRLCAQGVAVVWVSHDAAQLARVARRLLRLSVGSLEAA